MGQGSTLGKSKHLNITNNTDEQHRGRPILSGNDSPRGSKMHEPVDLQKRKPIILSQEPEATSPPKKIPPNLLLRLTTSSPLLRRLQEIAMKIIDSTDNPSPQNCFGIKTYILQLPQTCIVQVQPSGVQCPENKINHKEINTDQLINWTRTTKRC